MTKQVKIVLVEDNPNHANLLQKQLKRRGLSLNWIDNGQGLLDYLSSCSQSTYPHLLLLDLGLPDMSGSALLGQLSRHKTYKNIPAIILTASDELHDIELCQQYGYHDYMVKPPDYDKLAERIQELET